MCRCPVASSAALIGCEQRCDVRSGNLDVLRGSCCATTSLRAVPSSNERANVCAAGSGNSDLIHSGNSDHSGSPTGDRGPSNAPTTSRGEARNDRHGQKTRNPGAAPRGAQPLVLQGARDHARRDPGQRGAAPRGRTLPVRSSSASAGSTPRCCARRRNPTRATTANGGTSAGKTSTTAWSSWRPSSIPRSRPRSGTPSKPLRVPAESCRPLRPATTGRQLQPLRQLQPTWRRSWRGSPRNRRRGLPSERDPKRRFERADALVAIARDVLRGDRVHAVPTELVVTVAAETLANPHTAPDPFAVTSDGTCVSAETARRLACDCGVVPMVEDEAGTTLSVGRKTRSIPTSMKRALLKRDTTCQFPGCCNRLFLEGHHIEHWANGGETSLENLVNVCSFHHRSRVRLSGRARRTAAAALLRFARSTRDGVRASNAVAVVRDGDDRRCASRPRRFRGNERAALGRPSPELRVDHR
ncbi:MAG: HNH endonuclease [Kofleriaceae bacterium]